MPKKKPISEDQKKLFDEQIKIFADAIVSIRDRSESCDITNIDSGKNLFDNINTYHTLSHFFYDKDVRSQLTPMQDYITSRLRIHYHNAIKDFDHCQCTT